MSQARAVEIAQLMIGQQAFALAQMQAVNEELKAENERLKQRVAEMEVKETLWRSEHRGANADR